MSPHMGKGCWGFYLVTPRRVARHEALKPCQFAMAAAGQWVRLSVPLEKGLVAEAERRPHHLEQRFAA